MKIKHTFLFILLAPLFLIGQTLNITIKKNGRAINNAEVFKNKNIFSQNLSSILSIPVKSKDRITVKHKHCEDYSFLIPDGLKSTDTINKVIKLIQRLENLRIQNFVEFNVTETKYQNVFKNKNEFIIDYYPFPVDQFFVITKLKGDYFIKIINEIGVESITKRLKFKPERIFLDAIGNFHLINKDLVYQVFIRHKSIHLMNPITRYEFNKELLDLVALVGNGAFLQNISMHNQFYSLSRVIDKNASNIYKTFDKKQYQNAAYHYNLVVKYYMDSTYEKDNIIKMGIWDGNLMTLNNYDVDIIEMTSWSDKIASKPLNVSTYGLTDKMIILDGVKDSILLIDNSTLNTKKIKAHFTFSGDYFKDYYFDNIYMFSNKKGEITISKINIEDGTANEIVQLTDIYQPLNIKVMNDKVFFTVLDENRFNRIIEVKRN